MQAIVEELMPIIVRSMKDPSLAVRDTAAWTIGRACDVVPSAVIHKAWFQQVVVAMTDCLDSAPKVAANVCWVRTVFYFVRNFTIIN